MKAQSEPDEAFDTETDAASARERGAAREGSLDEGPCGHADGSGVALGGGSDAATEGPIGDLELYAIAREGGAEGAAGEKPEVDGARCAQNRKADSASEAC